jgi:hypothetical protein
MNIDLTQLDDVQLSALSLVNVEASKAVADERKRRRLFPSMDTALSALFEAGYDLENRLSALKKTEAVAAVRETGILDVLSRLFLTAEENGFKVDKSTAMTVVTEGGS